MEENRKHRKAVYCDTYNVHEKKMHTPTHTLTETEREEKAIGKQHPLIVLFAS